MKRRSTALLLAAALVFALLAGCAPSEPAASAPASPETSASASPSTEPSAAPSGEPSAEPSGTPTPSAKPAPSEPPVYTDWSKLDPPDYPEDMYTYSPHYSGEKLTPQDNYGMLLPYVGALVDLDDWEPETAYYYGVMDRSGRVVTDPAYDNVSLYGGYLILTKLAPAPDDYMGWRDVTIAAQDGRWVREMGLQQSTSYAIDDSGLIACIGLDGEISFLNSDSDGEITSIVTREAYAPLVGTDRFSFNFFTMPEDCSVFLYLEVYDGLGYLRVTKLTEDEPEFGQEAEGPFYIYLDPATGAASLTPPEGHAAEPVYVSREPVDENGEPIVPDVPGMTSIWATYDDATGELYYEGYAGDGVTYSIFDRDGNPVWEDYETAEIVYPLILGGTMAFFEKHSGVTCFARYDIVTHECIFRCVLRSDSD